MRSTPSPTRRSCGGPVPAVCGPSWRKYCCRPCTRCPVATTSNGLWSARRPCAPMSTRPSCRVPRSAPPGKSPPDCFFPFTTKRRRASRTGGAAFLSLWGGGSAAAAVRVQPTGQVLVSGGVLLALQERGNLRQWLSVGLRGDLAQGLDVRRELRRDVAAQRV